MKRIEICGGIASGKTTLTQALENAGIGAIYERFEDNPFLNAFYSSNQDDNVLETELVFLLLHYNWIKREKDNRQIVCDYSLLQDYCYGMSNLSQEDKHIFEIVYHYLEEKISRADLIIYLKCNVECLMQRIKARNRKMEQTISEAYIQSNIEVLEKYVMEQKNVLVIPSDELDFRKKDRDVVLMRILRAIEN